MSIHAYRARRLSFLGSSALAALLALGSMASGQEQPAQSQPAQDQPVQSQPAQPQPPATSPPPPATSTPSAAAPATAAPVAPARVGGRAGQLPQITVTAPPVRRAPPQVVRRTPVSPPTVPPVTPAEQLTAKQNSFDAARSSLYTAIGTTSDTITNDTIQALPQGTNAPVEKVLLQAPGVSQDSAASGLLHVRNDHANVQFRINGVMLPDGVTGFGSVLDTDLIGSISLITGALPAEYGMRTVGLVDITTRNDIFNNSGSISYYGGSRGTIEPSFDYGGTSSARQRGFVDGKTASRRRGLFRWGAIFHHWQLPADHRGHRKSAADAQCPPRFLIAGKGLRLRLDLHRPLYAPDFDGGNGHQQFPDSRRAGARAHPILQFQSLAPSGSAPSIPRSSTRANMRTPNTACWRCSDR